MKKKNIYITRETNEDIEKNSVTSASEKVSNEELLLSVDRGYIKTFTYEQQGYYRNSSGLVLMMAIEKNF